ncbi:MAG: hypothetical protein KME49_25300 [Brasilonema octagenarum HA4186-MV1]|jgi:hypothetical protein|nr:hypothetical protein [Brasilonema octagenarum HA4186-MV1]
MKTPKTPPSLIKSTSQEKSDTPIVSVSASKNQEGFPQSSKYSLRGTGKFKAFSRSNPCPVCDRDDSACRYSLEDQNFIQCFTFADARKRELINGYVCVKEASGHTASFVPDNSDDWNSERFQQLRQERQARIAARIAEQQVRNNAALSLIERDRATRQLHYCLGLSASHRQNLRNRGLSDAQIDAGYFFSVLPNADLPLGIPANYPGVRDGKLSVSGSGFACPIWTVDGLISGWQVRLDNESEGRYRWAKGIASSHLPNGELPITIVRPDRIEHNWVADIEGILKPYIAAKRLGAICLGAAGGNVTSSPEQIKDAIAKLNITQIIDFPDAGDILNHQVMRRRLAKYKFYKSLGLQVQIAWWGQITKEESDIDELESLEGIRYISIEEFVAIAQSLKTLPKKEIEQESTHEYFSQRAQQLDEEQEQFEQHAERHSEELAAGAKVQWMLNYPERVKRTHEALRSVDAFKPVIQDTKFINLLVDQFLKQEQAEETTTNRKLTDLEPGFYGLKVSMGGGKSRQMRDVVQAFSSGNVITFRNSIALQFCHDPEIDDNIFYIWDIKGIQSTEEQRKAWVKAKAQWMGGCIESLAEFKPKDILVLEEIEQVKRSLLISSTCRRNRKERLQLFKEHLRAAKYVFLNDADLSGSTLKWLQELDTSKKINIIHNITKRFQWQCYFYTGASEILSNGEIKLTPNNRAKFEDVLLSAICAPRSTEDIAHGKIPLIATDSQRWAESIERAILMVNPGAKGIRIDSTTKASDDPEIRAQVDAFLSNPNKWIEENQPDYVIYSPTCEASLDITIQDYFDAVYGCFVHANFLSCKQLLGRLRTNAPRHIFAKTHVGSDDMGSNSPLPQVLAKHMFQHNFETLREITLAEYPEIKDDFQLIQKLAEIIDFESGEYKNPHIQAIVEIKAQDNYSRSDLRKLLAEELQQCGHIVTMLEPCTQEISLPSSPHRKKIIQEWAEEIANSEDISIERAREIQHSVRAKMSERHAATKAILQYRLPDYTITSKFLEDYYLDDRNWITRQEMRYLLDHPEMSRQFDQETWSQALKNDTAWWDIRTNALKIKALSTLGIPAIAKSGKAWDKGTDWVLDFKELVLQNQKLVKLALNITAKEDSDPCYLLRRCLEQAGYPVIGSQRRKDGTRIRIYKVDAKVLADDSSVYADVNRAISRRQDSERIAKRFESKLSKLNSDVTASQTNPVEIIISSVCDTSDLLIPAGLEEIKENLDEQDPPPNYPSPPNELQLGDAVTINLPKSKHHGRLAYISEIYRSCGQDWVSASFDDGTSSKVDLPTHEVGKAFVKQATA